LDEPLFPGGPVSPNIRFLPGMAGVIPAWKLIKLLEAPEVQEMQRQTETRVSKGPRGKLDVRVRTQRTLAKNKEDQIDIPIPTEKQFFDDLKKITRRKPPL
jgi:hypothetical protein